ncbi:MAG: hypothetical protein ACPG4T_10190, partial [Nannocystaceae bacterium]
WNSNPRSVRPASRSLHMVFIDLTLVVVDDEENVTTSQSLTGMSLADGLAWAKEALGSEKALANRDYAMPEHSVGQGGVFGTANESFVELGRYYTSATALLDELAASEEGATAIAVWPHHFDLGGILFVPTEDGKKMDPEQAPQIGFGMSPGDEAIPEPYFYITPWPIPEGAKLPALENGATWHTEGFTGAILHASTLVENAGVAEQRTNVERYFQGVLAASRNLIAGRP